MPWPATSPATGTQADRIARFVMTSGSSSARSGSRAAADTPRRVLVTGASGGIGRAISVALARDGFDVVVHYHSNQAGAEQTADAIAALGCARPSSVRFDVAHREATSS